MEDQPPLRLSLVLDEGQKIASCSLTTNFFFPRYLFFFFWDLGEIFFLWTSLVFLRRTRLLFGNQLFCVFFANNLSLCLLSKPTTKNTFPRIIHTHTQKIQ